MDPVKRFSTRADNYAKYRPGYPAGVIDILNESCGLREASIIADVGSGTGIITELFLKNGNRVFAIEPNAAMRAIAERLLIAYPKFVSVDGSAEATILAQQSVDFVVAAQAFHWFDRRQARLEFLRILKPNGWVVLIWNERRLDSTPFLRAYEDLLLRYGTDYQKVRHENIASEIADFFGPSGFQLMNLENYQHFDFDSLKGRVLSSSYTPEPAHPNFEPLLSELQEIFGANQKDGTVSFEYETKVYYGHLALFL
jgi:ubiquinone/menaquinone biosynthesis C-methylase UbiE